LLSAVMFALALTRVFSVLPQSPGAMTKRSVFAGLLSSTSLVFSSLAVSAAASSDKMLPFDSLEQAAEFISTDCQTILKASRNTGRLLYRGEKKLPMKVAALVRTEGDLLSPDTFVESSSAAGVAAADYFNSLDKVLLSGMLVGPGHIATSSQKDASYWGPLYSIFPTDEKLNFGSLTKFKSFWMDEWSTPQGSPAGAGAFFWRGEESLSKFLAGNLRLNGGLESALASEHEILFHSPRGFVAVPIALEAQLLQLLQIDAFSPTIRAVRAGDMKIEEINNQFL